MPCPRPQSGSQRQPAASAHHRPCAWGHARFLAAPRPLYSTWKTIHPTQKAGRSDLLSFGASVCCGGGFHGQPPTDRGGGLLVAWRRGVAAQGSEPRKRLIRLSEPGHPERGQAPGCRAQAADVDPGWEVTATSGPETPVALARWPWWKARGWAQPGHFHGRLKEPPRTPLGLFHLSRGPSSRKILRLSGVKNGKSLLFLEATWRAFPRVR